MVDKHKQKGVFIRMPDDLIKKLEEEAESRMVSKTWLASRLVIEGLRSLKPVDAPWLTTTGAPEVKLDPGYLEMAMKKANPNYCSGDRDGVHYYQENGICMYCGAQDSI
jgi:hypothetical protein